MYGFDRKSSLAMPVMIKGDETVLFVHIPKTGGSSFIQSMVDRGWREELSIRGLHPGRLHFMYCSPQHMHAELLLRLVRPEAFDHIVTLVRDPLARLQSEYAWQRRQEMTDLDPEVWINYVLTEFWNNPFIYDNHIRPQHEFLIEGSKVFKLEDDGVGRAVGFLSPGSPKRTIIDRLLKRENAKDLKLKATVKLPYVNQAFERKISQIQDFYAKDYEVLGYACDSDSG